MSPLVPVMINRQITLQEALDWLAGIFEESPGMLAPQTTREEVPLWDSMGILSLMASMDESFGIVMSDEDVKGMRKIDDILAVLRKHNQLAAN